MKEFQERRKIKKFLYSWLSLVVMIVIFAFLSKAVWGVYEKEQLSLKRLSETEAQYKSLEKRRKELSEKVDLLQTPAGVEAAIRDKFPVVKDGEKLVVIVDSRTATSEQVLPEEGFWSWFMKVFR